MCEGVWRNTPELQVVVRGQVVVQLNAVLESLHRGMCEAHGSVVFLAEVGGIIGGGIGGGSHLDNC